MLLALWSAYEWVSDAVETVVSRGGFDEDYRRKLERLEKITRIKAVEPRKLVKAAREVLDISPVATPEIKRVANQEIDFSKIDFSSILAEIAKIELFIQKLELEKANEYDDEFAILLMI